MDECRKALKLTNEYIGPEYPKLFSTIGVHPTRCMEFENNSFNYSSDEYFQELINLINIPNNNIAAIGEFGLDYDRLQFCSKENQIKYFLKQFDLIDQISLSKSPSSLPLSSSPSSSWSSSLPTLC